MADPAYEAVVKETFQTKPLRTVLMVDDQFPTFADLARGQTDETASRFTDKERAARLYEVFQRSHMLCDIENVANEVKPERLRKSDLVVLDYHLGPGINNSDRAIEILRELSVSKHFNTVVVYTKEPDLNKVWLEIITGISGGWTALPGDLTGGAQQHWERLSDERRLPAATTDALIAYAKRRDLRSLSGPVRAIAQKELVDLGVPQKDCGAIIKALIHQGLAHHSGRYAGEPRRIAIGDCEGEKRWIQSGSVFVAIAHKGELIADEADPAGIMKALREALLAWRPNLIQIVVSEIQNILELEALASEDDLLKDPITHTALWYYLLTSLGPINPSAAPDIKVSVMAVIDKIVDGVRRRLSSDPQLLDLASRALLGELRDVGLSVNDWPKDKAVLDKAVALARTEELAKHPETMFRLNSFLSTERFSRAHLTTGTVFRHEPSNQYFVAASPACDLVARRPSKAQFWTHSIHPNAPLIAVLLSPVAPDSALMEAAHGEHIFFERNGLKEAFKIVSGAGDQPPYEILILANEGRVRDHEGKIVFEASRLAPKQIDVAGVPQASATEREWIEGQFEIVAQLRAVNATHILQITGQHLSRIGMDFISMPKGNG